MLSPDCPRRGTKRLGLQVFIHPPFLMDSSSVMHIFDRSQFLPIPKNIHALACETISRRIGRLPFTRNGVEITEHLVGVTMECLNAEARKTLTLRTVIPGKRHYPGTW